MIAGGATVIVLTLIIALVAMYNRHRNQLARRAAQSSHQESQSNEGFSNQVYGIAPPAYDNVVKSKLPEYDEVVEQPPVYEEIKKTGPPTEKLGDAVSDKGVDNPVYMEDINLEQK